MCVSFLKWCRCIGPANVCHITTPANSPPFLCALYLCWCPLFFPAGCLKKQQERGQKDGAEDSECYSSLNHFAHTLLSFWLGCGSLEDANHTLRSVIKYKVLFSHHGIKFEETSIFPPPSQINLSGLSSVAVLVSSSLHCSFFWSDAKACQLTVSLSLMNRSRDCDHVRPRSRISKSAWLQIADTI